MHGKMCVIILNYYKDFDQQHKTINNNGEKFLYRPTLSLMVVIFGMKNRLLVCLIKSIKINFYNQIHRITNSFT